MTQTRTQVSLRGREEPPGSAETVFRLDDVHVHYGKFLALRGVNLDIPERQITALIGPSGCGKSTLIRCLNRMNDLIPGARVEGRIHYHGQDLNGDDVDPVEVRRRIGMVFQKPNPFPKSIYENVAFGPRVIGLRPPSMDDLVERSLRDAALWDEVKDKLKQNALALSGGQQQRLCIARAIAVSHNMQQAARISDRTALFNAEPAEGTGDRTGVLVEFDRTDTLFTHPADRRTEDYITGRFG